MNVEPVLGMWTRRSGTSRRAGQGPSQSALPFTAAASRASVARFCFCRSRSVARCSRAVSGASHGASGTAAGMMIMSHAKAALIVTSERAALNKPTR